jgi:predicted metal-binding membrane protein
VNSNQHVPELASAPRHVGRIFAHPRATAVFCVAVLAGVGWIYLALMVAGAVHHGPAGALGPGMAVFERLVPPDGLGRSLIEALCRPTFARGEGTGLLDFALALVMWCAMALAMMLPTAGPMVVAYADIAETAQRNGEAAVSPHVLAAGYTSVWLAYAGAATVLQWALVRLALLDPALAPVSGLFSGAVFLLAGAYQFSALKHACVTRCQRPSPFFFANWTTEAWGVLRLGLRQGVYCLGCCWAVMLVMFAVGVMNVVWMAGLGVIMTVEKITTTTRASSAFGIAFIFIGMAFIIAATISHWPVPGALSRGT